LEKGFVVIKSTDNKLIKNINTLKKYKDVVLKFVDGKAKAKIKSYEEK
jgi:exonuclease VII large subunit